MKKLLQIVCVLFLIFGACESFAQITILRPMLNNPSAFLSDWQSRSSTATVIVNNTSTTSRQCILWTEFFLNGNKIAYTQPPKLKPVTVRPGSNLFNGEDIAPLNAVHFENNVDISSQRAGRVPDGTICIIVHVMDAKTGGELAVSPNDCAQIISYFPPQLMIPADQSSLCRIGNNNVIYSKDGSPMPNFQWTPIAPAPTMPVDYRFAIFEVYPNQQPITAILANRALVQQDIIGQTSLLWPIQYFLPEPGKTYVWSVRALDASSNPFIQSNQGWAAPFVFSVSANCDQSPTGNTTNDSTKGNTAANTDSTGSTGGGTQSNNITGNNNASQPGSGGGDKSGSSGNNPNGTSTNSGPGGSGGGSGTGNPGGDDTGGMQSMMRDKRSYTAGKYAIELDGLSAGWIQSAEGGHATSDIAEKTSDDHIQKKHIAGVKYEDISVTCGANMRKNMYDWIKSSFDRKYTRKSGAIIAADYNYKEYSRVEFNNALISEIGLPALDAASKDAAKMTIKFSPEWTRYKKGDSTNDLSGNYKFGSGVQKQWTPSNFRLKIDGLDDACKKVNKIEAITLKQKVVENPVGEMRTYEKEPAKLEFPNLVITIPESHSNGFYKWQKDSVINTGEKKGTLDYLDDSGNPLFTLTFQNLKIFKITPDKMESGSEGIRRVKVEMYVEQMKFDYSGAGF
ncbi:MAG TPA: phage tail protein [Candidatus Kapabacteria bacterium]|nr:phage tail protein [Candidatus Kapabacteria bacterium]